MYLVNSLVGYLGCLGCLGCLLGLLAWVAWVVLVFWLFICRDLSANCLFCFLLSFICRSCYTSSMTNGTRIDINDSGTQLRIIPGVLKGGDIQFDCNNSRSIGYYLEGILPLAPFGKEPLKIQFTGVTDGYENVEPSVDLISSSMLPIFQLFGVGIDDDISPSGECVEID